MHKVVGTFRSTSCEGTRPWRGRRWPSVLPQHGAVSVALDCSQDLSVNCSLISPLLRGLVGLLLGLEDVSLLLGLLSLNPGEVLVVDVLGDRHLGHVELGGGGDQVP